MGGDCTWTGCVPSKTLLSIAKTAHSARTASHGISVGEVKVDMKAVKARIDSAAAGSNAPERWHSAQARPCAPPQGTPGGSGRPAGLGCRGAPPPHTHCRDHPGVIDKIYTADDSPEALRALGIEVLSGTATLTLTLALTLALALTLTLTRPWP